MTNVANKTDVAEVGQRRSVLLFAVLLALITNGTDVTALAVESIQLTLRRHAYYRGESISLTIESPRDNPQAQVDVFLDSVKVTSSKLSGHSSTIQVPTGKLRAGKYLLKAVVRTNTEELTGESQVSIAHRPSPDRLDVWLWGGSLDCSFYFDHGFTIAGGPYWSYWREKERDAYIKSLDRNLIRGVGSTIWLCGGITRRDLKGVDPKADDVAYLGAGRHAERFYNPFSPIVEQVRRSSNDRILRSLGDHPAIRVAFFNTELVDDLWLDNLNREGVALTKQTLGYTRDELNGPTFVSKGVLSDDDRKYRFNKFVYQKGNGLAYANRKAAEDLKRHRPDVRTMTDPYRIVAYRDMFPGLDIVSTWTYTNNDPKLMHYIETLRAVTRRTGQEPMQTVTLLNYPGVLAPKTTPSPERTEPNHAGWMLMGPDRCKEVSWIILSRAPKQIGYYFSSACDPQKYHRPKDQHRVPYATSLAIKELSDKVYKPFGPMITRLRQSPRRMAVLSSQASRLCNSSPNTIGYPNLQIYGFYSVMAMAHYNADVLLDEQVEAGELKKYEVLAMPRCEAVTQSMFKEIQAFQRRGGTVIADQYLGAELDNVIRFDFDFSYRRKVNADAIESGVMYAEWDDQLNPKTAKLTQAQGVTADEDQKIMESYARQLRTRLAGTLESLVTLSSPKALVNVLEFDGVKYLFLINDHREYGDRLGKHRAMLEKLKPLRLAVKLNGWKGPLYAYDLLQQKALPAKHDELGLHFPVELDELGGKIIALYRTKPASLRIEVPQSVTRGDDTTLRVKISGEDGKLLSGLQPMHVTITDTGGNLYPDSGFYCAEGGELELRFQPAVNDSPGNWNIGVKDLTTGMTSRASFDVH